MRPAAIAAMLPFLAESPGNPSGAHGASRVTKTALEEAREIVAERARRRPERGRLHRKRERGRQPRVKGAAHSARERLGLDGVVTTAIEHKAVLGATARLEREGSASRTIGAHADGRVDLDALAQALDDAHRGRVGDARQQRDRCRVHTEIEPLRRLHGVGVQDRIRCALADERGDLRERLDDAGLVVDEHHRDDRGALVERVRRARRDRHAVGVRADRRRPGSPRARAARSRRARPCARCRW